MRRTAKHKTFIFLWLTLILSILTARSATAKIIYVDSRRIGIDGTSWFLAYKHLQDALADANTSTKPVEIWVAKGTYKPDREEFYPMGTADRSATFQLINGVTIYGGFPEYGGDADARDWENNKTILSGEIRVPGEPNDNIYHIVTGSDTDSNAILDGFTITQGTANHASAPYAFGGGIYSYNGNATIRNCTFTENWAHSGGGIYNTDSSNLTLNNCTFNNNSSYFGAAIYNTSSSCPEITNCKFFDNSAWGGAVENSTHSDAILTGCTFTGNYAELWNGGAIRNLSDSDVTVTNCRFYANSASAGGAMSSDHECDPVVTNSIFVGNIARSSGGGGLSLGGDIATVTNCTFAQNTGNNYGGGIYVGLVTATVANCIFWDNIAPEGAQISLGTSSDSILNVSYCDIQGGLAAIRHIPDSNLVWGVGNIDTDPNFQEDPNDGGDGWGVGDDDFGNLHLTTGSVCIDAGDNNSIVSDFADLDGDGNTIEAVPFDIDKNERISNSTVDIGADEIIWKSDTVVPDEPPITINPGDTDEGSEVVIETGPECTSMVVEVIEMGAGVYSGYIDPEPGTSLLQINADSYSCDDLFMTVIARFNLFDDTITQMYNHGFDTFHLMYLDENGHWVPAVSANTNPDYRDPYANRTVDIYPDEAPTVNEMRLRGLGANGVYIDFEEPYIGFVWANVDHMSDFAGFIFMIGDIELNNSIDFYDFAKFAEKWKDTNCGSCSGADFTGDGNVDEDDLLILSQKWLYGK